MYVLLTSNSLYTYTSFNNLLDKLIDLKQYDKTSEIVDININGDRIDKHRLLSYCNKYL